MDRKLPIGIQSFEGMRKDGFVYVDKTAYVHRLAREGKSYFLSRPRRFGKSLLVSTLRAYFEGRRDLFEGLAIEALESERPDAWTARPVFHLDFNGADYTQAGALELKIGAMLRRLETTWGADDPDEEAGDRFQNLLAAAHARTGHRVAVLVDEYDKPMLDIMHDPALEEHNRAVLKGFYSVLKGSDEHLRFAFLTGVTKFSKVSIFSDLNQLRDISLEAAYAGVCGITEDELVGDFSPELNALADKLGLNREGCLERLREMYDGYCFHPDGPGTEAEHGGRRVYNPFSLLNAFASRRLRAYWFATGTPTFLYKRMRDMELDPKRLTDGSIYATDSRLLDYRVDDPDPVPLLYQTGYLTIRAVDDLSGEYSLEIPNGEVEWGLLQGLLPAWAPGYSEIRGTDVFTLRRLVERGDTNGMRHILEALFASIPYTREDDPFENYFQAIIWLVLTLLGRFVRTEIHQATGRVDCVVEAREHVYVMELKRDGTAAEALAQVAERGYAAPFAADPRELHVIGCTFDSKTRRLADWAETR